MSKPRYRRLEPDEQQILDHLIVRPIRQQERRRYDALMKEHFSTSRLTLWST